VGCYAVSNGKKINDVSEKLTAFKVKVLQSEKRYGKNLTLLRIGPK